MFSLFRQSPPLDDASRLWLFQTFTWAHTHFQSDVFWRDTQLVVPNNTHFPGRESSADGMAQLIFSQVQQHAHMQHWPLVAVNQTAFVPASQLPAEFLSLQRGKALTTGPSETPPTVLPVPYHPALVSNPEALIASYADSLAHYLVASNPVLPPGGESNWAVAKEVLAVYMGFGLMLANTAFQHRGGCGSSSARMANRDSQLSQYDVTYALAIFSHLKRVKSSTVTPHLKSYLRGYFKRCLKDIKAHEQYLPSN